MYLALGPRISLEEMAQTFARVTEKQIVHSPKSFEVIGDLSSRLVDPAFKDDAIEMVLWAAVAPDHNTCYGVLDMESKKSSEDLNLTDSSFQYWRVA